jgi:hypothetical protein
VLQILEKQATSTSLTTIEKVISKGYEVPMHFSKTGLILKIMA